MAWYLNRALTNFRAAVNSAYPNRDKTSDGTIGDEAHQDRYSDHNPDADGSVDAWDMDVDLRSGNDPAAIENLKRVFQAHESSSYWIHNDQIASRNDGWRRRSYAYAGADRNRHLHHVHWNTRESYEDSNDPWILEDDVNLNDVVYTLRRADGTSDQRTLRDILTVVDIDNVLYWITDGAGHRVASRTSRQIQADLDLTNRSTLKGLPARLDAILAAALDDTNPSVQLSPEALAELQDIRAELDVPPDTTEPGDAVADLGEGGSGQARADGD
jgi:hypothetical protein